MGWWMGLGGADRQHVSSYDGGVAGGREEGVLGDADVDGLETALVERDVFGY